MIITAIERSRGRRGRVDVFADGERCVSMARQDAEQSGLRPGSEIARDQLDAIIRAESRKSATQTAVAMLARRPRSEREVRRKLAQRQCPPDVAEETITRLRNAGLLDDAEFARCWTESRDRISPRGQRLITGELRALGVEASIARDAAAAVSEPESAYRLAQRRVRSLASLDERAFRDRLGGYLRRRGFGWSVISETVRTCWAELGRDAADDDFTSEAP